MGRHKARTDLGREWGATDVVPERGEEGLTEVMELIVDLAHVAEGYQAMDARESLKALVIP